MRNPSLLDYIDYVDSLWGSAKLQNYPPTDFIKLSDTEFELVFAVAGFSKEDIDVSVVDNILAVQGAKIRKVGDGDDVVKTEVIYKGISNRSFKRTIALAKDAVVKSVSMRDGLLTIKIDRVTKESNTKKFDIS